MRLPVLAAALILAAGAALADEPIVAFEFRDGTTVNGVYASGADLELAETTFDMNMRPAVSIRLNASFDAAFAALTARNVGRRGQISVCGKVVSEPMLQSELSTARFIVSGLTMEEANMLAAQLQTRSCDPTPSS
jgi:preprotein translocase subunit SecD